MFDQTGRRISSIKDNNYLITLDLGDKDQGIYNLKLTYDSQVIYKRIVKYH